ncbi:MAG: outer membrane beta-barrel protein [Legionella sp.]|jgi:outer membrane immunogenic protein
MKKIIFLLSSICYSQLGFTGAMADISDIHDWNGFYVGGNIGGLWSNPNLNVLSENIFTYTPTPTFRIPSSNAIQILADTAAQSATGSFPLNGSGVIGGAQFGVNMEFNNLWVFGLETDLQGLNSSNNSIFTQSAATGDTRNSNVDTVFNLYQKTNYLGTLRGRLGISIPQMDSLLVYVTGGLAYGEVQASTTINGEEIPYQGVTRFSASNTASATQAGYTLGAGFEKYISSLWSVKVEYLYYNLGTLNYDNGELVATSGIVQIPQTIPIISYVNSSLSSIQFSGSMVRAGINYKFA